MDCTHDCTTHTAALSLGFQSSGRMVTTSEAVRVKAILDNINHIKKIFVEFNHANYEPSSLTLYTAQENDIRMRTVVEELTILKAEDTGELKLLHLLENLNISPTVSVMSCVMIGLLYQQVDFCAKTKGDHE
uniref:Interleukin 15 n=1 Tax=Xenopus tropicalis TaxID=8364 RepID=A0A803JGL3_XENTR